MTFVNIVMVHQALGGECRGLIDGLCCRWTILTATWANVCECELANVPKDTLSCAFPPGARLFGSTWVIDNRPAPTRPSINHGEGEVADLEWVTSSKENDKWKQNLKRRCRCGLEFGSDEKVALLPTSDGKNSFEINEG